MDLNTANLKSLNRGFTSLYNEGSESVNKYYDQVVMEVPSTGSEEVYGWLGDLPNFREWLGDRVVHGLASHDYSIKNKKFELTVSVQKDHIEDDKIGQYNPRFRMMGEKAAKHPDSLVFPLLKNGFTSTCYDGQYFFDTDHPVLDENGAAISVSNTGGGSGNAWFLLDTSSVIRPFIFQKRRDYNLVSKDNPDDENVFKKDELVYGIDARVNAGYGLWQLAYGSKQDLTSENYEAAYANIVGRKGDYGQPLGLKPTLLVVGPSNRAKALKLITAEKDAYGADNINKDSATVLVVPYLD